MEMIDFAKFCAVAMTLIAAAALLAGAFGQAEENMQRCSVVRCT